MFTYSGKYLCVLAINFYNFLLFDAVTGLYFANLKLVSGCKRIKIYFTFIYPKVVLFKVVSYS